MTSNDKLVETSIILYTDGLDTYGKYKEYKIQNIVNNAYTKISIIFFGHEENQKYSEYLVPLSTGGGP